jgi:hypothetical protein
MRHVGDQTTSFRSCTGSGGGSQGVERNFLPGGRRGARGRCPGTISASVRPLRDRSGPSTRSATGRCRVRGVSSGNAQTLLDDAHRFESVPTISTAVCFNFFVTRGNGEAGAEPAGLVSRK